MHIARIQTNTSSSLYQTTPSSGSSSGGGFQIAAGAMRQAGSPAPSGAAPSMQSQMTSTLLQLQELDQTHGGGGGGGHHGGMKMFGLEAEEAAESEEAQPQRQRKKLGKIINRDGVTETVEVDENGVPVAASNESSDAPERKKYP